jgi:hypothetical protein
MRSSNPDQPRTSSRASLLLAANSDEGAEKGAEKGEREGERAFALPRPLPSERRSDLEVRSSS